MINLIFLTIEDFLKIMSNVLFFRNLKTLHKKSHMYIEIVNKVRKIVLRETPGRYTKRSCSSSNCHVTHCARDLSMQRA